VAVGGKGEFYTYILKCLDYKDKPNKIPPLTAWSLPSMEEHREAI
jgi:hypothetical protein